MEERGDPEAGTVMVAGHQLYLQQTAIYGDHNWGTLLTAIIIGVAGSFSEGGQPFRPAKIQSFPATIFSCQGGGQVLQFCPAKLPC